MARPDRFDVLVQLRERDERRTQLERAAAERAVASAREALAAARDAAGAGSPLDGSAAAWELLELSRAGGRARVADAEQAVRRAEEAQRLAAEAEARARRKAEVVRRVAERRRAEARVSDERREAKTLDDLAGARHARRDED